MQHNAREFLDLLREYKSEETRKARRNLSTIAFVVIAVRLLGIRLQDVKVLGVDISHSSDGWVYILALALLFYWAYMLWICRGQDQEIQRERELLLGVESKQLLERWAYIEQRRKDKDFKSHDYETIKAAVEAYEKQQQRLSRANEYGAIIGKLELYVPGLLALAATGLLSHGFWIAL